VSNSDLRSRRWLIVAAAALVTAGLASAVLVRRGTGLPGPGDTTYEQTTRAFYHGLAALEVGLLDDARQQFTTATELIGDEPASWVNLGITQLRLGELDAAVAPIERGLSLAPDNSDVVLAAGRMEIARGRLDEGVALLQRAVELDPRGLRARYALAEEVARSGVPGADDRAQALFDELAQLAPANLAVLVEHARIAARRQDGERLGDSVERLERASAAWPPLVTEQLAALRRAVDAGAFGEAARLTAPLRNVLASVPAFRENLADVQTPTELIAEPIVQFVALEPAPATPAPADAALSFVTEQIGPTADVVPDVLLAFARNVEGEPLLAAAGGSRAYFVDGQGSWPFDTAQSPVPASALLAFDWDNDFRTDVLLAGASGPQLLLQREDGSFAPSADQGADASLGTDCCSGAWAADIEMDGDLDVIVGMQAGASALLRNNGNGTWTRMPAFDSVTAVRDFVWADLDRDADPDAIVLDASGALHAFTNRQAGDFAPVSGFDAGGPVVAVTVADLDADGAFDVVTLDSNGAVRRLSSTPAGWNAEEIARWEGLNRAQPGTHRVIAADLDNNGALDLVAAGAGESRIWLTDERYALTGFQATPEGEVFSIGDMNGDGFLDLVATTAQNVVRHLGRGQAGYHWKVVHARAQANAGDQRINSFGRGGDVQVRSGLLLQHVLLTGSPVHVGLGRHTGIDVARIVWPNGVAQAEFGIGVDDAIVAEQRLKGSCPWVFVWDGTRMRFVTDFLWRSPLGLRINAQDTAGVGQTEDWVRIAGEHLAARNGAYDVRITAELWETHFFDHVSLMVVDHPAGTEVFVDERFSAAHPPRLAVRAFRPPQAVSRAWDDSGRDVTDLVARVDGRYLASFERGPYQGIAADHVVEIELSERPARGTMLLASGWIYPTDSSINVAIAQGNLQPKGLSLEALGADGRWTVVHPDLGFPAGKNKTILIDLDGIGDARRVRLRTNLEIYWDRLALAEGSDTRLDTQRLGASGVELAYRGFSITSSPRGEAPETPEYERIANTGQRWRDLEGFHTRFGEVRELLAAVDDRYVIMNAGDELRLLFPEQPAPPAGWRRDFVLIGDGWEKDGDFNTGFSQTVLPLPSHDNPEYAAASVPLALEDDPVYRRHRDDWTRYHTRFVAPDRFVNGLRRR
jgi:tetratricopeptide (TPR) repeat protein